MFKSHNKVCSLYLCVCVCVLCVSSIVVFVFNMLPFRRLVLFPSPLCLHNSHVFSAPHFHTETLPLFAFHVHDSIF